MTRRLRILAVGLLVASLGAGAIEAGQGSAAGQQPTLSETQAAALAAAPSLDRSALDGYPTAAAERAAAGAATAHVPLPEGGNFNGIEWERTDPGLSTAEVETVVEYNAFCQWLRASRDGGGPAQAVSVLTYVPSWPGFRDQPDGPLIQEIVAEAHAGEGVELDQGLADCAASHMREVRYAEAFGLSPGT